MSSSDSQAAKELLVEILTEELPALPFLKEWGNIAQKWEQALANTHLQAPCELHYTPRRIAIYSRAFPTRTDSITQEFFGAPVAMAFVDGDRSKGLSKAGEGFCKKIGLDPTSPESIAALQTAQKDGKEVLYYRKLIAGTPSEQVLGEIVVSFIRSLHFGKSMRWGDAQEGSGSESFIRPIRNIMILLGGEPISAKVDSRNNAQSVEKSQNKKAESVFDNHAAGGRIFDEKAGLCSGEQGDKTWVSIDEASHKLPAFSQKANAKTQKARSPQIFGQQSKAATLLHRSYKPQAQDLLESTFDNAALAQGEKWVQITGIDDYLHKLKNGGIILSADERKERILAQIRAIESAHQVQVKLDSALLAQIVAITEYPTALLGRFDERFLALPEEVIITSMKEHQKYFSVYKDGRLYQGFIVVANALCDDFSAIISGNERVLKARLSDAEFFYRNDCATPLAKEPLASIAYIDGLGSMLEKTHREEIIGAYLARLWGQDSAPITQALALSKADLLSEMVGEFPELQGIMGHYYALAQGLPHDIAQAIKEQYLPNGENSALPSSKISAIVALSGKLESLLGLFSLGTIPSGSKDPFALRRAANGVVKIALEWNLAFDIKQILVDLAKECGYAISQENLTRLQGFIIERLESILDIPAQIFRSASRGTSTDLCTIASNAKALESLLKRDDREKLMAVFKRVANITKDISAGELVGSAQKVDSSNIGALLETINTSLLTQPEQALYARLCEIDSAKRGGKRTRSSDKLAALFDLRDVLEAFFDKVLVNDDNPALRRNRKTLLYAIYAEVCTIGDLKELAI